MPKSKILSCANPILEQLWNVDFPLQPETRMSYSKNFFEPDQTLLPIADKSI